MGIAIKGFDALYIAASFSLLAFIPRVLIDWRLDGFGLLITAAAWDGVGLCMLLFDARPSSVAIVVCSSQIFLFILTCAIHPYVLVVLRVAIILDAYRVLSKSQLVNFDLKVFSNLYGILSSSKQ